LVELNFDENLIVVGTLLTVAASADYGDAISVWLEKFLYGVVSEII